MAIQSFKDERCARIFRQEPAGGRFPPDLVKSTYRKLLALDRAGVLDDLAAARGNRLHALKDDRASQHSISVNDQFRICFVWTNLGPKDVEFVDYH